MLFTKGGECMKIVNCGFDYQHPSDFKIQRPNGSGDYILLVIRSPAFFVFEEKIHYTKGNSVVIFNKGTPQIYGALNEKFINDWIHFEADKKDLIYLKDIGIVFDKILEFNNITQFSKLIKSIFFEKYSTNKNASLSTIVYFNLLLLKISDLYTESQISFSELTQQLTTLRNKIFSNPQNNWNIDQISKELLISKSYLQHKYKQLFKTNIKKDITSSRVEYAKYLLFSTDYTISYISNMCGYENDVHFMRVFKRETGYTPTTYRNSSNRSYKKIEDSKYFPPFSIT